MVRQRTVILRSQLLNSSFLTPKQMLPYWPEAFFDLRFYSLQKLQWLQMCQYCTSQRQHSIYRSILETHDTAVQQSNWIRSFSLHFTNSPVTPSECKNAHTSNSSNKKYGHEIGSGNSCKYILHKRITTAIKDEVPRSTFTFHRNSESCTIIVGWMCKHNTNNHDVDQ